MIWPGLMAAMLNRKIAASIASPPHLLQLHWRGKNGNTPVMRLGRAKGVIRFENILYSRDRPRYVANVTV
jgi:hypothetical protein